MNEVKLKKLFGKRLKNLRQERKLTQEKLSELVWIDPQHFCKMENGNHFPTLKNLINLANALEIDIQDLFSFDKSEEDEIISQIVSKLRKMTLKEKCYFLEIITSYLKMQSED